MAKFACLIYPFHLIYLNYKLPKAARTNTFFVVVLLLNVGGRGNVREAPSTRQPERRLAARQSTRSLP
jgi:hypothetical protein